MHGDAFAAQLVGEAIELDEGLCFDDVVLFTEVILEEVIGSGLGVEAERDRADPDLRRLVIHRPVTCGSATPAMCVIVKTLVD